MSNFADIIYHLKKTLMDCYVIDISEGENSQIVITFDSGDRLIIDGDAVELVDE